MINESILTKTGLEIYNSELLKHIKDLIGKSNDTVLEYTSSIQFPTVGKINTIYIDMNGNKIYRWDDDNTKYYCIGSNYEEINLINCGDSNI